MQTLKIHFENCYGIKKLVYDFDFSSKKIYAIYAPNGTMKTSFAKTMYDFSQNTGSKDLMFPLRTPVRMIHDEANSELVKESILVIKPYDEKYKSQKRSTLLVKAALKDQYDAIHTEIEEIKNSLLEGIASVSNQKKDLESKISNSITKSTNDFFIALERIESEVLNETPILYENIKYTDIFDDKILTFLSTPDVTNGLKDYILKYNELLEQSPYLKNGFNHYNASTIQKNLNDNGFFRAAHSVILRNGENAEIVSTAEELQTIINTEKNKILNNVDIQKLFKTIDDKIQKNAELRAFGDFLFTHQYLLPKLTNLQRFEQELWINYFKIHKKLFQELLEKYRNGKAEIASIVEQAKIEATDWESAIEKFNTRFYVPFRLKVSNKDDVILKGQAPSVEFDFEENGQIATPKENELLEVLSQGEKRALYILNIIFEIEARRKQSQETVFIIDDIADSFDYKNKYAIIEYLKEIAEETFFYQIILTHNFDFYRTVGSRLGIAREHRLYAVKTDMEIFLKEEIYQNNPFKNWSDRCDADANKLIALIPFVRNLIEYTRGEGDPDYVKLTNLLHIKTDTATITHQDLVTILQGTLPNISLPSISTDSVLNIIYYCADTISAEPDHSEVDLEKKIVLSIAIRLKAEKYMIDQINDNNFVQGLQGVQTFKLFKRFKTDFLSTHMDAVKTLEKVNLMTAENIHLNSFMYEPLLDMSDNHLKSLYHAIKNLV